MTQDRRAFLFYTSPVSKERHFFGLADTIAAAIEIEDVLKRDGAVRALFPGHPTPLLGAGHVSMFRGERLHQALIEVRALRAGTSTDAIARTLHDAAEQLKPELAVKRQEREALKREFAQELIQGQVEADLAKRLPANKVAVAFAVWSAVNELPKEWIERSALESLGISPTSLDQDWTTYGSQLSPPVKLVRPTMYLKSYVLGYVLNRWTPRSKRQPKRRT